MYLESHGAASGECQAARQSVPGRWIYHLEAFYMLTFLGKSVCGLYWKNSFFFVKQGICASGGMFCSMGGSGGPQGPRCVILGGPEGPSRRLQKTRGPGAVLLGPWVSAEGPIAILKVLEIGQFYYFVRAGSFRYHQSLGGDPFHADAQNGVSVGVPQKLPIEKMEAWSESKQTRKS